MIKYKNSIIVAFMALIMGSCTTAKLPAVTSYTINIPSDSKIEQTTTRLQKVLRVAMPRSTAAIMSRNILYQGAGYSLNAYAFSKWSDTPNRMLANLFLAVIEDKTMFKAVLPADSSGNSDYMLESSIQQFHQQIFADESSAANIRIGFYVIETRTGKVIATREFISKSKAKTTDATGGVSALNHGAHEITADMVAWLASLKLE